MFPVIAEVKMFPNVRKAMTSVLPDANASNANPRSVEEKRSRGESELDDLAIVRVENDHHGLGRRDWRYPRLSAGGEKHVILHIESESVAPPFIHK